MIKLRINEILEERNKSLYWLSQKSGITYSALHNLANKQPQSVYFSTLEKIMEALDIEDFNELLIKD